MSKPPRPERPTARHAATTPRERVLAAWRGVDVTGAQSAGQNHSRSLAKLLPGVLSELGLDRRRGEAEIIKVTILRRFAKGLTTFASALV